MSAHHQTADDERLVLSPQVTFMTMPGTPAPQNPTSDPMDTDFIETVRSGLSEQQRTATGLISPQMTKSSKSTIRLELPPVVMRPPKVKEDGFSSAALSWLSWNKNEEKDVPDCARSMRRSYTQRSTFHLFGFTLSKDINYKTSEGGIDAAVGNFRITWGKSEFNWVFDRLPRFRQRLEKLTGNAEITSADEERQNAADLNQDQDQDRSSTTAVEDQKHKDRTGHVRNFAHPWLTDYYYVVVGLRGDEIAPKEVLRRVMRIDGLFKQISNAHRRLRGPFRRALSLKETAGFGIYECDPSKGYHREVDIDTETETALAELWRSYRSHKLDFEGRWLLWIHQHFNNSSKKPEMGRLTLELKLRWSVYKVVSWGVVPILLSLAIGFWYMYKDHGDTDAVHVAEAAWVIATYIITTSACKWFSAIFVRHYANQKSSVIFALLAVITQLGDI